MLLTGTKLWIAVIGLIAAVLAVVSCSCAFVGKLGSCIVSKSGIANLSWKVSWKKIERRPQSRCPISLWLKIALCLSVCGSCGVFSDFADAGVFSDLANAGVFSDLANTGVLSDVADANDELSLGFSCGSSQCAVLLETASGNSRSLSLYFEVGRPGVLPAVWTGGFGTTWIGRGPTAQSVVGPRLYSQWSQWPLDCGRDSTHVPGRA